MTVSNSTPEELRKPLMQRMEEADLLELRAEAAHQQEAQKRFTESADEVIAMVNAAQAREIARQEAEAAIARQKAEEAKDAYDLGLFPRIIAETGSTVNVSVKDDEQGQVQYSTKYNAENFMAYVALVVAIIAVILTGIGCAVNWW